MSTRKNRLVIILMYIKFLAWPIILPLRCINEVVEGFSDVLYLFRFISKKALDYISIVEAAVRIVREHGPLDLVDVAVKTPEEKVKIKILMR